VALLLAVVVPMTWLGWGAARDAVLGDPEVVRAGSPAPTG
jgi:hypothetical protein